jgi:hypothetical protein
MCELRDRLLILIHTYEVHSMYSCRLSNIILGTYFRLKRKLLRDVGPPDALLFS